MEARSRARDRASGGPDRRTPDIAVRGRRDYRRTRSRRCHQGRAGLDRPAPKLLPYRRVGRPGGSLRASPARRRAGSPAPEQDSPGWGRARGRAAGRHAAGSGIPGSRAGAGVRLGPCRGSLPDRLSARPVSGPRVLESRRRENPPRVRSAGRPGSSPLSAVRGDGVAGALAASPWSGRRHMEERRDCDHVLEDGGRRGGAPGAGVAAGLAVGEG